MKFRILRLFGIGGIGALSLIRCIAGFTEMTEKSVPPAGEDSSVIAKNISEDENVFAEESAVERNSMGAEAGVELHHAEPWESADAVTRLKAEARACAATNGTWNATWLSCSCPKTMVFIANLGCSDPPAWMCAHAGCEGPRAQAPSACFRYLRAGPVMFDLNFRDARALLQVLRTAPDASVSDALFEDATTTLPKESESSVRLHQTHYLQENVAAFAFSEEPWLPLWPPNYVFVAPLGPAPPRPKKMAETPWLRALRAIPNITDAVRCDLAHRVDKTYGMLCKNQEHVLARAVETYRVAPSHRGMQRTLTWHARSPPGPHGQSVCDARLIVTMRDEVPLSRTFVVSSRYEASPVGGFVMALYLGPQGALRAMSVRALTTGPVTAWHLFGPSGRLLNKNPVRTIANPRDAFELPAPGLGMRSVSQ